MSAVEKRVNVELESGEFDEGMRRLVDAIDRLEAEEPDDDVDGMPELKAELELIMRLDDERVGERLAVIEVTKVTAHPLAGVVTIRPAPYLLELIERIEAVLS